MQICLYSSVFFPSVGGIEQVSSTLATYWVKQGHLVTVVTDTRATDAQDEASSFPIIRCPKKATWKSILPTIDVIVSNGYSLRHLGPWLLSGKPIIWIHQTYIPKLSDAQGNLRNLLRSLIGRVMLPLATRHVYISQAIQKQVGSQKGVVINNPVDTSFHPLLDATIENDFAFFGRMVRDKGVDTLLEALAICQQKRKIYNIDLYGEGQSLKELQALAQNLGVASQVRWYPFVRGEALVKAMNLAGAVVMPSRWAEPMGVVAVEAMACGKAVIGSRLGGLGEVLEGYGMTFDNGNAEQLAECMIQFKEYPDLRVTLEKKAYERSQDFAIEIISSKYLQLFESVLKN